LLSEGSIPGLGAPGARPAVIDRIIFHIGHAFDAACDHHVGRAGPDAHGSVDHRLEAGTAAAVELNAGDGFRQSRRQS